jgi:HD-GYP domain-containing protein (c-di-GMP phosphodiesterase class II)
MGYINSGMVIKCIRKVLNVINEEYLDSGMTSAYLMKKYVDVYDFPEEIKPKLVLLCLLKNIGCFYQNEENFDNNPIKAAASSYAFLKHCSPFGEQAKPLLFYKSSYKEELEDEQYYYGMLITLIDKVGYYIYSGLTTKEIEDKLNQNTDKYQPYQVKTIIELLNYDRSIIEKLKSQNSLYVYEVSSYIQNVKHSDIELLDFIDTIVFSFEFHNNETLTHTITTAQIAKGIAKLARFSESQIEAVYYAGLLHDMGKIKIPNKILTFPGKLSPEDMETMKTHVIYSKELLEGCFPYEMVNMAYRHHERLDGSGYPNHLTARDITTAERIVEISDVISSLYTKRSYKESMNKEEIISQIRYETDLGKFDKRISDIFIKNYDEIMAVASSCEEDTINRYNTMQAEYNLLLKSNILEKFFD